MSKKPRKRTRKPSPAPTPPRAVKANAPKRLSPAYVNYLSEVVAQCQMVHGVPNGEWYALRDHMKVCMVCQDATREIQGHLHAMKQEALGATP